MRRYWHILVITLLLWAAGAAVSYGQGRNNLVVAENRLILLIDLRSKKADIDNILKRAGLNNVNSALVLRGNFSGITKQGWKLAEKQSHTVQFIKPVKVSSDKAPSKPYMLTINMMRTEGSPGYPADVTYGVNKFSRLTVRELPNGQTRFFLPGFLNVKRVLLSGSFNTWSTSKGIMLKTDSGWIRDVPLAPGVYAYKFILNGKWAHDFNNQLSESDGFDGYNSIYYRYNYSFKLNGYTSASKVYVAGNFNKWDADEIPLRRSGSIWTASLYLHDGMFAYRFMVDGKWMADPANPSKVTDEKGAVNSVINLGEQVEFKLKGYTSAQKVCVAGNFNGWRHDMLYLKKTNDGWALPVIIPPGNYRYKFIVDGRWITDPAKPCYAVEGDETNSFIAVAPNYTFRLKGYASAQKVKLAGTFNNWDPEELIMGRKGDEWFMPMRLPAGKQRYKYIVDGNWILDPGNKLWEPNEHNTGNSIIWIEQDSLNKNNSR